MKIKQLSVFLENRPGQLSAPIRALAEAKINISTLCLADTKEFGILRLIIEEHDRAKTVLEQAGYALNECEVLAVEIPDRPGGLAEMLEVVSAKRVNLSYMYAFSCGQSGRAMLVLRFDDPDRAIAELTEAGMNIVSDSAVLFGPKHAKN